MQRRALKASLTSLNSPETAPSLHNLLLAGMRLRPESNSREARVKYRRRVLI